MTIFITFLHAFAYGFDNYVQQKYCLCFGLTTNSLVRSDYLLLSYASIVIECFTSH